MSTWGRPSWAVTSAVLITASASLTMTAWYLWPGLPFTAINFAIAATVVTVPLLRKWPISTERALIIAGIEAAAGWVPGGYIFGEFVFLGALVSAATVLVIHGAQTCLASRVAARA